MARTAKITNANVAPSKNKAGLVGNTPVRAQDFNDLAGDYVSLSDSNAQAITSAVSVAGVATATGGLVVGTEALTGAGACSTTVPVTFVDTTGGVAAITLAASTVAGAMKTIIMVKDGGDATLTIASVAGAGNTYAFANVGESLHLINAADEDGTIIGWAELSRGSGAANTATAFDGPVVTTV